MKTSLPNFCYGYWSLIRSHQCHLSSGFQSMIAAVAMGVYRYIYPKSVPENYFVH